MSLRKVLFVVLVTLLSAGVAQELPRALPGDTLFAVGVVDLAQHEDKLTPILEEAERLDLAGAFEAFFGTVEEDLPETEAFTEEIPEELQDLDWVELFGEEAWLTISVSSFNPMPAITLTLTSSSDSMADLRTALDRAVTDGEAEQQSEGTAALYLFPIDDPESPIDALVVGHDGTVLSISTNPEVVRGVYRRLAGAGEASLADNAAYSSTVGQLGAGTSYTFMDFSGIATAVEPYAAMAGMEALTDRILNGVRSAGAVGSVSTVQDDGFASTTLRMPGAGDDQVNQLLAGTAGISREPLTFVAPDFLGVSVTHLDLPGWWSYLGDLARSSRELGNPDLDMTVQEFTGINLQQTLFSWMGTEFATLTGDLTVTVEPGVASENLLGNAIYMISTTDEAAASQGLSMLFGTAAAVVSSFTDPTGQGIPQIDQREIAGTAVTSYGMGPGITVAHAVVDGWALVSTSDAMLDAALLAHSGGGQMSDVLERMAQEIPDEASAYGVTDYSSMLRQMGSSYASQLQLLAGLTGGEIDFDALVAAGESLEQFFAFLADRAGGSVAYTVVQDDGSSRSETRSEFRW